MNQTNTLSILQYNVRKSKDTVMASMLRDPRAVAMDILAIQEPWRNPFMATTHHPAKDIFHLCYPVDSDNRPVRVCFFVNKRLDNTKWQFQPHTRDAYSLSLRLTSHGDLDTTLSIHNVYNPPQGNDDRESALPQLRKILANHKMRRRSGLQAYIRPLSNLCKAIDSTLQRV